mgnify:CR=1 FL=1
MMIDPVAGSVVKDIFHLKLKGHSLNDIAENLNLRGILTPLAYKRICLKQNLKTGFKVSGNNQWEATMVRRIFIGRALYRCADSGKNHNAKP